MLGPLGWRIDNTATRNHDPKRHADRAGLYLDVRVARVVEPGEQAQTMTHLRLQIEPAAATKLPAGDDAAPPDED